MFTNKPSPVAGCCVLPRVSDHCRTVLKLCFIHTDEAMHVKALWGFDSADVLGLQTYLHKPDWSPVLSNVNVSVAVDTWY